RLVSLKRLGVLLFVLLATLCAANTASAHERTQTKTRVRDFELAEHHSYELSAPTKQRNASGKSRYWCPNSHQIHSYRWRDPSARDASDVADWISRQDWIDDLAPALAGAGVASDIPPLVLVGEAALVAIDGINAIASLEAHRQSAAAISDASNSEKQCSSPRSPEIRPEDLTDKTADELRQFAQDQGLVPNAKNPNKFMDPVTNKERLRLDRGHVDENGQPYYDPNAAVPHVHGYEPNGKTKVVDPVTNNPHFPTK
ncbi:MAG: hypothetical protein ABUL62_02680, partial [Myxococcales bacterium]